MGVPSPVSSSSVWRALFKLCHNDGSSRDKSPIKHVNWRFFTKEWSPKVFSRTQSTATCNKIHVDGTFQMSMLTKWQIDKISSFSLIWRRGIYSSFLIVTIQLLRGEKMAIKEALTEKYLLCAFMQASLTFFFILPITEKKYTYS